MDARQSPRILLVDDEAVCADFGHALLTRLGYEVVVTTQSHEAWVAFHTAPQRFAVLITDYCMPGWTGLELAAACRQLRADLPIILCTGESPTAYARQAAAQRIDAVLSKPFHLAELTRTLQQILTRRDVSSPP